MRINLLAVSLSVLVLAGGGANAVTNLLTNGSFETGDLTGWSLTGDTQYAGVSGQVSTIMPEDGDYQYYNGAAGSEGYLGQTFADVVGARYLVSGWVASLGSGFFELQLDGADFASSSVAQPYTQYTHVFIGTGSDTVTLGSEDEPTFNLFDNFLVSAVPEPFSWAMIITGFGAAGGSLRHRRAAEAHRPRQ